MLFKQKMNNRFSVDKNIYNTNYIMKIFFFSVAGKLLITIVQIMFIQYL